MSTIEQRFQQIASSLCVAAVKSKLAREEEVADILGRLLGLFDALKLNIRRIGVYDDARDLLSALSHTGCKGLVVFVGTGGTEPVIVGSLRELKVHTLLIASETFNSLAAMLEAYAALRREGRKWVHAVFLDLARLRESKETLLEALRPLMAVIDVKYSRVGLIGGIAPWLVYSRAGKAEIRVMFGADLVDIPVERVIEAYEEARAPPAEVERLRPLASPRITVEQIEMALRLYYALRRVLEDYRLDAATIQCFNLAKTLGVTPCYALARLNSEGYDVGCEGDLPSLFTMMLSRRLSEIPAMMGNIVSVKKGEVTIAHCTAPLALASSYMLETHMETGLGVGVAARLPSGRQVTLAKIDLPRGRLVAFHGRIVGSGMISPRQCRTQVIVKTDADVERLLEDPVGSHLVLTLGNIVGGLATAARLLGLEFERL